MKPVSHGGAERYLLVENKANVQISGGFLVWTFGFCTELNQKRGSAVAAVRFTPKFQTLQVFYLHSFFTFHSQISRYSAVFGADFELYSLMRRL